MQMSKSAGTEWSFILHSESALAAWGAQLASILKTRDVIALEGNLGSGKTTLARAIIRAIYGEATVVPSPTFTLVQIYEGERLAIWHCDLYRLKGPEDTFEIGLDEAYREAVTLIECMRYIFSTCTLSHWTFCTYNITFQCPCYCSPWLYVYHS